MFFYCHSRRVVMIFILIAIPADACFLNGYVLNGYTLPFPPSTNDTHTHCHSCWCIPFEWIRMERIHIPLEWIRIEWILIDKIRVEWICVDAYTPAIFRRTLRQNVRKKGQQCEKWIYLRKNQWQYASARQREEKNAIFEETINEHQPYGKLKQTKCGDKSGLKCSWINLTFMCQ